MISLADLEEVAGGTASPQPISTPPPISNTPDWNTGTNSPTDARVTGYAIQLSANPTGFSDDRIRKYDALAGLGNLYTAKEGNMYKLRLGVYSSRETANAVLSNNVSSIVKDAFVLQEPQATASMLVGNPPSAPVSPTPASTSTKGTTGPAGALYAVQVASWPIDNTVLVSDYANLTRLGQTYIQPESNRLRVRVGTYSSYEQAQAAQTQAIQLGYKDAIIVRESAQTISNDKLLPASSSLAPATTPAQYSTPTSVAPTLTTESSKYYVRVCAVDDPYNFNAQQVNAVGGVLEKWPIGTTNKTAIMLTGFPSVGQAMVATDKLRMNGYQDAYIIQDQNGRMSKYRY